MEDKMQHKFHAAICFFLGFIALNGIIEGAVTRFEIELLFIGLALIMMLLWMILPPGRLALTNAFVRLCRGMRGVVQQVCIPNLLSKASAVRVSPLLVVSLHSLVRLTVGRSLRLS